MKEGGQIKVVMSGMAFTPKVLSYKANYKLFG